MRTVSLVRALVIFSLLLGLHRASGAQVNWGTTRLAVNYTSDWRPMSGFTFEVGAFEPGFEPNEGNVAQWGERWLPAGSAAYSDQFHFATGSVAGDAIESGLRGYIWGFDAREGAGLEWILVTDPGWVWGGAGAAPVDWTVGSAGQSVVGSVGADGAGYHMLSASISVATGFRQSAESWQAEHFGSAGAPGAGWDADPDGDGVPNALELVFGTSPVSALEGVLPTCGVAVGAGGAPVMRLRFDGAPIEGAPLRVEVSNDLLTWVDAAAEVARFRDGTGWVVEDSVPVAGGRRFLRVVVDL